MQGLRAGDNQELPSSPFYWKAVSPLIVLDLGRCNFWWASYEARTNVAEGKVGGVESRRAQDAWDQRAT